MCTVVIKSPKRTFCDAPTMIKLADEIWKSNFEAKNLEIRLIGIQMNNLGETDVTQTKMSSFLTSSKKTNPFESKTVHVKTKIPRTTSPQRKKVPIKKVPSLKGQNQPAISNLLQDNTEQNCCPLCGQEFDSVNDLEMHIRNHCPFLHCLVHLETGKIKQFFD